MGRGKVIGVASSGLKRAQNVGYIIPAQIVNMFLNEVGLRVGCRIHDRSRFEPRENGSRSVCMAPGRRVRGC